MAMLANPANPAALEIYGILDTSGMLTTRLLRTAPIIIAHIVQDEGDGIRLQYGRRLLSPALALSRAEMAQDISRSTTAQVAGRGRGTRKTVSFLCLL